MIDPEHPNSIPLLDADGNLRPILGFDYESHCVASGNGAPRAVCASFWSRTPDRDEGYVTDPNTAHGRICEALAGDTLLVGQNVMYDVTQSIAHAERRFPADAVRLREAWLDAFAANRVIDTKERDKLIAIAFGLIGDHNMHSEGLTVGAGGFSLRDIVRRRFMRLNPLTRGLERVDLSADKKPGPCATCASSGKIPNGRHLVACADCKGTGTYVPWRLRYHELEGTPIGTWPKRAVEYSLEDAKWVVDIILDQGGLFPEHGSSDLFDEYGVRGGQKGYAQKPVAVLDYTVSYRDVVTPRGGVVDEAWQYRKLPGLNWKALWGLRTNRERGEAWGREVTAEARKQSLWGLENGFVRLDGTTNKKALQSLVEAAYYATNRTAPRTAPTTRYPDGQVKTNNDALRESRDPVLVKYAEFGTAKKNMETFLPIVRRGYDHPITYRFDPLKRTGRTSASNGLHQPPRGGGFRGCFEPRPGHVLCSVDWSGAETITLAQVMLWLFGANEFTEQVLDGVDTHTKTAVAIFNAEDSARTTTYEEAKAALKDSDHPLHRVFAGDPNAPERTPERIGLRQFGKVPNFGFRGGLGPGVEGDPTRGLVAYARAMAGIHLPLERARKIKEVWLDEYPVMRRYFDRVSEWCGDDTFTYENWVSGRKRGGSRYTDGCNAGFQPLVGDALGLWEWLVALATLHPEGHVEVGGYGPVVWGGFKAPGRPGIYLPAFTRTKQRSPLYGSRGVLSVHDEQILELPWDPADPKPTTDAAMELSRLGVAALGAFCPDMKRAIEAEPALCLRWHKSMKAVWRDGGGFPASSGDVLLPWEPKGGWNK